MRKYQPIWNQVKNNKSATIIVPVGEHKKAINGVRQEKCRDYKWRHLQDMADTHYKLYETVDIDKGKITFKLLDKVGIKETDL